MIWLANIKTYGGSDTALRIALDSNKLYIGRENKYVGLPESKWHNPFPMKKEGERIEVLKKYLEYIIESPLIEDLHELDNKTLFCWCSPKMCHGNLLIKLREFQLIDELGEWITLYDWIDYYNGKDLRLSM